MTEPLNKYGDQFTPTGDGHGVDISSQRQDELDAASLDFIKKAKAPVTAVDLGGGFGAHAVRMTAAGAEVVMIDISDITSENFKKAAVTGKLRFLQKDFAALQPPDLPENFNLLYSQRAIHYVPYAEAAKILGMLCNRMASGGGVFLSAAGWDTEYGKTHPARDKPVAERFDFVSPEMQKKHAISHKIAVYKEQEFAELLERAGFSGVHATQSAFGNIKATARKA